MSYPGYPPYGQPPPPQGGYYQQPPPHAQYGAPPPPSQYHQPPPQPYGQAPPQQPYGHPPPQQPYGQPPPQPYGAPSPQSPYGAPPPQPAPGGYQAYPPQPYGAPQPYGHPPPQQYPPPQAYPAQYPPTPPSVGYGPPQIIQWNGDEDAQALRSAMKGWGTDERRLVQVLANKDPLQMATIRDAYTRLHRRNLEADIKSETSGWFEKGLVALVKGPLEHDIHLLRDALQGVGTNEAILNDVLLGRSNADMNAIKSAYHRAFRQRLEDAVRSDLSMKTERHFMIVLSAQRAEDSAPVVQAEIDRDVNDLYNATEGKIGTDEMKVCSILSTRNDDQIRAIAYEYERKYARNLETVIRKEFSGHMEDALLFQLRHGMDKYMHQAQLLEDAMAGAGTKDKLLVSRLVRFHWDRSNFANVRGAYEKRYRKNLVSRVRSETSGDYERLVTALCGGNI